MADAAFPFFGFSIAWRVRLVKGGGSGKKGGGARKDGRKIQPVEKL